MRSRSEGWWAVAEARIGVIGGTGLYQMEGLKDVEEVFPDTPFGKPSDAIVTGTLGGVGVAFLPRHGRGHRFFPSEIPARANIYALKALGVERVISVSAVGSLREEIRPLDMVIPDQLIDRTMGRVSTFFGDGIAAHVGLAEPFCPVLREALYGGASRGGATAHPQGTYVVIEGPQFSTRAESRLYRSWGADVIGMTALPEAKLAREAEMCYATLACSTDYDCWHESETPVTVEMIVENLNRNTALSKAILGDVIPRISGNRDCPCGSALGNAIITARDQMPPDTRRRLALLIDKYIA
ncbi:MAG: S-methyl-5'-thioadenosine phosphorylase [Dehalococcoidia bacterium]|nr:S-methyl-5'-thioadenosine phosphorylase [Dehalococcoidia bacterium]